MSCTVYEINMVVKKCVPDGDTWYKVIVFPHRYPHQTQAYVDKACITIQTKESTSINLHPYPSWITDIHRIKWPPSITHNLQNDMSCTANDSPSKTSIGTDTCKIHHQKKSTKTNKTHKKSIVPGNSHIIFWKKNGCFKILLT